MRLWTVDASDKIVGAKLKRYRSDKRVMSGCRRTLRTLAVSGDPAAAGSRKRGRLRNCHSYTITRPRRIPYTIDYEAKTVRVPGLGDHKEVYGGDRRA